ncbi:hypothetical protein DPMN_102064, partial [Dreissena polymorpha]
CGNDILTQLLTKFVGANRQTNRQTNRQGKNNMSPTTIADVDIVESVSWEEPVLGVCGGDNEIAPQGLDFEI